MADDRAQQRRLADAVAAKHRRHPADFRLERDRAKRLRGAVEQVYRFDAEHCLSPEVNFDDALVGADLVERPLGEHGALVQTP